MSPPSKPAITARRSTASNSNSVALHSVCIGAILDSEKTVLAQHFSQILRPDAPLSFEKSRLATSVYGLSLCLNIGVGGIEVDAVLAATISRAGAGACTTMPAQARQASFGRLCARSPETAPGSHP